MNAWSRNTAEIPTITDVCSPWLILALWLVKPPQLSQTGTTAVRTRTARLVTSFWQRLRSGAPAEAACHARGPQCRAAAVDGRGARVARLHRQRRYATGLAVRRPRPMRRLGLDTEAKLVCLERRDAGRYRDLLQGLAEPTPATSRSALPADEWRRLSLFDHLQRRYLVPHNPFFELRRPREPDGAGGAGRTGGRCGSGGPARRRACRRIGCPLAVLDAAAGPPVGAAMSRRARCNAGVEPYQLPLW